MKNLNSQISFADSFVIKVCIKSFLCDEKDLINYAIKSKDIKEIKRLAKEYHVIFQTYEKILRIENEKFCYHSKEEIDSVVKANMDLLIKKIHEYCIERGKINHVCI